MNFIEFRNIFERQGVFSTYEAMCVIPGFNRCSLTRWQKAGYIEKLRNGWYALTECLRRPNATRYIASRIYAPSYISLETALSIYDIIPEAVTDATSCTSRKTARFDSRFGHFFYYTVKPELMFGYRPVQALDGNTHFVATAEKAILDFLYLHPEYKTEQDMMELRFDEIYMCEELDRLRLSGYLDRFGSNALTKRTDTLLSLYD